jgi:hypothetical protein
LRRRSGLDETIDRLSSKMNVLREIELTLYLRGDIEDEPEAGSGLR